MKTVEQVQEIINNTLKAIELLNKEKEAQLKKVTAKIEKYKDDPEYVSRYIQTWMQDVKFYEQGVESCYKKIKILSWMLED